MAGIEKSVELYELIIARLEDSGVAPHQLEYYRECLEFFRDFSTAEEAEAAMRKSPLYTKGGQALMLDKFVAYVKAMEYCGYDDAAEIYRSKYDDVKENYAAAWDTTYTGQIAGIMAEHAERKALFMAVVSAPVDYMGAGELPSDAGTRKMDDDKLKEKYAELSAKGLDFFEMAKNPFYRELVPLDDAGYAKHMDRLREILSKGTMAPDEDRAEYERIKGFLGSHKEELRAAAAAASTKKVAVMAVPNESAPDKYDFIDRAEEA